MQNVRVNVRELGNTAAETNRKQFPSRVDFIGSCRLLSVGVGREFSLLSRRSWVRSPPPLPNPKKQKTFLAPSQHLNAESAIGPNRVRLRALQLHLFAFDGRQEMPGGKKFPLTQLEATFYLNDSTRANPIRVRPDVTPRKTSRHVGVSRPRDLLHLVDPAGPVGKRSYQLCATSTCSRGWSIPPPSWPDER